MMVCCLACRYASPITLMTVSNHLSMASTAENSRSGSSAIAVRSGVPRTSACITIVTPPGVRPPEGRGRSFRVASPDIDGPAATLRMAGDAIRGGGWKTAPRTRAGTEVPYPLGSPFGEVNQMAVRPIRSAIIGIGVLVAVVVATAAPAVAAPGDLDTSFGTGGRTPTPVGGFA